MSILNDVEAVRALDPENMYNRIFDLPEQMTQAMKLATGWNVPAADFPDVKNIVVVGMGGSAIGGDIARSFLSEELLIPFQVCRNYVLPEYVDDETLVIASSYSGNTEETLAAIEDAMERSAMIAAISTGGLLEEIAQINDIPMMKLPEGLQPRAAIGYSFVPLMMFLEKIGIIKDAADRIKKAIAHLKACRDRMIEDRDVNQNPAKQLASLVHGKLPIIYGGPTLSDVMAVRWKAQICENAKLLSFCNVYPEFNHNELVGWTNFPAPLSDYFIVINLRDTDDHPKVSLRMDVVKETIEEKGVQVIDIYASGETRLERMFSLLQMGDFVSYYLAILGEVDPTPVEIIENLKKEIAERSKAMAQQQASYDA